MSARQQFFPRPASRATHVNNDENNSAPSKQFQPDPTNPLNQKSSATGSSTGSSIPNPQTKHHNPEPKQLNLSSLRKPRLGLSSANGSAQGAQNQDMGSPQINERGQNPTGFKARGSLKQQINIASPTPHPLRDVSQLLATSSPNGTFGVNTSFSESSFRMPVLPPAATDAIPASFQANSGKAISQDAAHTSTQFSAEASFTSPTSSLDIPNPRGGDMLIDELSESTNDHSAFNLSLPFGDYSGPQRVLLEEDGLQDSARLPDSRKGSMRKQKPTTKRSRADFEDSVREGVSHGRAKHLRPEQAYTHERESLERDDLHEQYHPVASTPAQSGNAPLPRMNTLDKLLGLDVDQYIESHLEKYEEAREKWKTCSMDEWTAGADGMVMSITELTTPLPEHHHFIELTHRFGQVLDFVKDHMTTKMKLFATMNQKIDEHNTVLDERSKSLVLAKDQLVKDSGTVLGR
ncbi:hypothetical protein PC9H_009864 [Pleurotus ostreatus]|uniref:Extracellular mutant protein 11 C-terminal domain-containing protein n=1 Tax=Pleurotus ostreatus TaxID=5322 RepID=A0A8H7DQ08_PLEOS|nr:uncharacterized protein PC9H_009864 [Pleurotus ostreatus]KAF7424557.1 hypothetical protein PC9H_009864 [Pleurotus ostreatus]